ncbi:SCP2 sterol-binding domain-containing protein [Sphingosinicella soli]|nr:SCP2 sterol-binding domain-containing protein [Sphingosinicella soli]
MASATQPTTPAELMRELDTALRNDPSRSEGITSVFAFDVAGDAGGKWWIEAKDGTGAAQEGQHPNPDVVIYVDDEILVRLGTHDLDGGEAYVSGLITLEGDNSKAMLLAQIFGD